MTNNAILEIIRGKRYKPTAIDETDGQFMVFMENRKGVTNDTLFRRFKDTRLRVVGFGWERGRHYVLFRVVGN